MKSEFEEQADFVAWFEFTYPEIFIYAIRNGGSRTQGERWKQKREGVRTGVADLHIPALNIWIEMKREKGGKQSQEQKDFEQSMRKIGHTYLLCNGFETAKNQLLAELDKNNLLDK